MRINITDLPDISENHSSASEAIEFAITNLEVALSASKFSFKNANCGYYELRRDMPYVIHGTSIENTYILVNRNYKPLGSNKATAFDYVRYEDYTNLHVRLTKQQISSVVSPPHESGLFGDSNPPWSSRANAKAYLVRLQSLHTLINAN